MRRLCCTTLLLAVFTAGTASALTIDEAVELALDNNHRIKEALHLEQSAAAAIGVSRSDFHPSFDASYAYRRSEQEIFNLGDEASTFTLDLSFILFRGK